MVKSQDSDGASAKYISKSLRTYDDDDSSQFHDDDDEVVGDNEEQRILSNTSRYVTLIFYESLDSLV